MPEKEQVIAYVFGILTVPVAVVLWVLLLELREIISDRFLYVMRFNPKRRYRFIERSTEGNAVAITLPWWPTTALVVRVRFWRRRWS